jgi:uncharacterized DUF497 family protein
MIYDFEWDSGKALSNQQKHGVSFRLATTVLRDPMALTIYDKDHSSEEDRWVTLGRAESGQHLVVIHTWNWIEPAEVKVRIISARRADAGEVRDYQNIPR